jgi:sec-independent protein translocase protein TatA
MPNVGPWEIFLVLIVALLVFGPKKLPEMGRSMGKGIREFKGSLSGDDKDDDVPHTTVQRTQELPPAAPPPVASTPPSSAVSGSHGSAGAPR